MIINTNADSNPSPYLSIVVTSRNDSHGGNMLERMQLFIDGLLDQCNRFGLPAELIIVDWNPPQDKPPLMQALNWPEKQGFCSVRCITVPNQLHQNIPCGDRLPLFQMIAKNVGIRRAKAPFIIATNIDILFSDALFAEFAKRRLKPNCFYRCDRLDVLPHPKFSLSPKARLDWCSQHVVRYNEFQATRHPGVGTYPICWPMSWQVFLLEKLQDLKLVPIVTRKRLHTNACGDMTLMHRDIWQAIHGYSEEGMYSMHIDSLALNEASRLGFKQVCFKAPMVTYHLEHDLGSGWSPEGEAALNARLEAKGIPQITFKQYHDWCIWMRRGEPLSIAADTHWGWPDQKLDEASPY